MSNTINILSDQSSALSDDKLYPFKAAMLYLGVSRSTLYRLMWNGKITGKKVGVCWRFLGADLKAIPQNCDVYNPARASA